MKYEIEIPDGLVEVGCTPIAIDVTGKLVCKPTAFKWPDWLLASRCVAITRDGDGWLGWLLHPTWDSEFRSFGVDPVSIPIGMNAAFVRLSDFFDTSGFPDLPFEHSLLLRPSPERNPDDPRGDGDQAPAAPLRQPDAIRERLMRPFLGRDAESVGATTYEVKPGERWQLLASSGLWTTETANHFGWHPEVQYRLTLAPLPQAVEQPVDMLGREVVDGDVMWGTVEKKLSPHGCRDMEYRQSVRCPRPGEQVPDFEGWQEMCKVMQEQGACFLFRSMTHPLHWSFDEPVSGYRRSPDCTWGLA